ncbi:hypothetical protein B0I37DRAFT_313182 [Chaetomium sp. MPI-CAGE-AT-0009]|nr:hypothetical protein B0I37DRAFT_313182 [Chaetomium sp. MPI-CAGE-AT-0009]
MPRPNFNKHSSEPPKRNAPSTPIYSDASSSYWPPGWNFEKFSRATAQDRASLPEGELEKMQAGLRDVLGDGGVGALAMYLFREEQRRAAERNSSTSESTPAESTKPAPSPNWLRNWSRRHHGEKWGFLGKDLPAGLSHCLFLCASQEAVDSVTSLDEDELPTLESVPWRPTAPFLLAVSTDANPGLEEGHEEREWFKPVFKVAAETIVDELWPLVDSGGMPLRRITRHVKGSSELGAEETADGEELEDIWWTMAPSPERLKKRRRGVH